jgi:hypothetical protein
MHTYIHTYKYSYIHVYIDLHVYLDVFIHIDLYMNRYMISNIVYNNNEYIFNSHGKFDKVLKVYNKITVNHLSNSIAINADTVTANLTRF